MTGEKKSCSVHGEFNEYGGGCPGCDRQSLSFRLHCLRTQIQAGLMAPWLIEQVQRLEDRITDKEEFTQADRNILDDMWGHLSLDVWQHIKVKE